jgi:alcohol dehydrogenase groES domain protein
MKSVSLIGNNINISEEILYTGNFNLENEIIHVGLVTEDDFSLKESSDPDNRVLVKKRGFSCNYRDKTLILNYNKKLKELEKNNIHSFSYIGSEFVGEVIDKGKNVSSVNIGDRVVANASYPSYTKDYIGGLPSNHASRRIDDFRENKIIKIPNSLSDEIASSFVIAAFTGYSMIRKVVKPNMKVLVTAAKSNTSLSVINALRNFSVDVYAMTTSKKNNDYLYELGVKKVFVVDQNLDDYLQNEEILQFLRDKGFFDAVIDPLFDIYLNRVIKLMNYDSKYITCGIYNQFPDFSSPFKGIGDFTDTMKLAMIRNISIIGNCIGLKQDFDLALQHFEKGLFNITIDSVFSTGDEAHFFDLSYNFSERLGKVVYLYE